MTFMQSFVGGLVFASIDQIPGELIDNAIILGCLSFFAAFLLLVDMSEPVDEPHKKRRSGTTQTDAASIDQHFPKSHSSATVNSQANLMEPTSLESVKNAHEIRSKTVVTSSNNPFIMNEQQSHNVDQQNSLNSRTGDSAFAEDIVESHSLPSMQMPVFSKVKPTPTIAVHHLESEPYRKIIQGSNHPQQQQSQPYSRYHDTALQHQDPSFYDDFNSMRKQTYYQGPKVDQGKLVIRDYSNRSPQVDVDPGNVPMQPGYVHQVASYWNSRSMDRKDGSQRSDRKEFKGSNTLVW